MPSSKNKLLFTNGDFERARSLAIGQAEKLSIIADMIRFNALAAIVHARSGHIGASFSAIEILAVLYHHTMRLDARKPGQAGRDIFILSKGHAAAGQYAALASAGFIPEERLLSFRQFRGLQGHVDVSVPGVDANTGSLGMGLSKGKGYAWAAKAGKTGASVYVMVGDGELQEGQNWEAIQSAPHLKLDNLYLIVDRNMVQTDREVHRILDISPLDEKLRSFGWDVMTIDGNDVAQVLDALGRKAVSGKPKAIIANTIKGKGVSFMEHPAVLSRDGVYRWHGSIPKEEEYRLAYDELAHRLMAHRDFTSSGISFPQFFCPDAVPAAFKGKALKKAFSDSLVELAEKQRQMVVMDADLAEDCGLRDFENRHPDRFIEVGIAEQDMVSMAGGLALCGKLPIVNTYTAFLTSRSNEQIFNNASEKTKIIYVGHLAGLLPAKPGKSHQGLRDISLLRAVPDILLGAPCNAAELKQMMDYFVLGTGRNCYLRLEHFPPRNDVPLPKGYRLGLGKGAILAEGKDAAVIAYGSLMLSEALSAAEELKKDGIRVRVINLPWLNNIDARWLLKAIDGVKHVFCIENHSLTGGQGEEVLRLAGPGHVVHILGVAGFGQSGEAEDILRNYSLDYKSISARIAAEVRK